MANNRMYLTCLVCVQDDHTPMEDCRFFLAKYYPREGWYIRGGQQLKRDDGEMIDFVDAVDAWFAEHKHGGMYGDYILPMFESAFDDPMTASKRAVLEAVAQALIPPPKEPR